MHAARFSWRVGENPELEALAAAEDRTGEYVGDLLLSAEAYAQRAVIDCDEVQIAEHAVIT